MRLSFAVNLLRPGKIFSIYYEKLSVNLGSQDKNAWKLLFEKKFNRLSSICQKFSSKMRGKFNLKKNQKIFRLGYL